MRYPLLINSWLVLATFVVLNPVARAAPANQASGDMDGSIARALEFLQRTQEPDGSWKAGSSKSAAITALSVMAFLSAGHVPGEGPYGDTVEKGVRWILSIQQDRGLLAAGEGATMYHHGIATLMLAEVAGMTEGKLADEVRRKLEKAVGIILDAQRTKGEFRGGWRYQENSTDADISVTGWQLLALRAAKNLGCDVPPERIDWAVEFIKHCQDPKTGGFCYMPRKNEPNAARTGTGILCLELCGKEWHRSPEVLKAGGYLLRPENLPNGKGEFFFYSIYYCSQATFQLGGNYWSYYRERLHKVLRDNQAANGSWHFADQKFGPQYGTAMSVLALTVEYRLLPIYQRDEEPSPQAGS